MTSLAFKGRRALLLIGVVALWASNFQPAHAGGGFARGDVAAGVGNGLIRVFDANGNLLVTLDNTTGSYQQTGMCFDPNGDFYSTDFGTSQMSKFDGGGTLVQASWGGPFGGSPEDCLVAQDGTVWSGEVLGANKLRHWSASGTQLAEYSPAIENQGIDWFDLNADQCVFDYTSEGPSIKRFNVCTNTQLPDFATSLPGNPCYALRIRSDGGVLVGCHDDVNLLDAVGNVVKSYPRSNFSEATSFLFALNLDPDLASFWTADFSTGNIYRIDIATGNVITHFQTTPVSILGGLAIFGEPLVSADTTPPSCTLTAVIAGPPKQVKITVEDAGSGLLEIVVTKNVNATVDVPVFTQRTTAPVIVTGTKTDQSKAAQVGLAVVDVAGNQTDCDPDLLSIKPGDVQRIRDVPRSEHWLTLSNGSPGLRTLRVTVNRKTFELGHLRSGEVRVLDISSAMVAGSHNTVTIRGYGRRGSSADVVLSD